MESHVPQKAVVQGAQRRGGGRNAVSRDGIPVGMGHGPCSSIPRREGA